jgi:hypothetical protein
LPDPAVAGLNRPVGLTPVPEKTPKGGEAINWNDGTSAQTPATGLNVIAGVCNTEIEPLADALIQVLPVVIIEKLNGEPTIVVGA